jgi:CRISPR system Cascade subunit CasC
MARFVQLHLLTFYPPANLNRDDTGRPKTAIIGGVERLRISSQSLKRAVRTSDVFRTKLDGHLAKRTQRLGADINRHLVDKGMEEKAALATARRSFSDARPVRWERRSTPAWSRPTIHVRQFTPIWRHERRNRQDSFVAFGSMARRGFWRSIWTA